MRGTGEFTARGPLVSTDIIDARPPDGGAWCRSGSGKETWFVSFQGCLSAFRSSWH